MNKVVELLKNNFPELVRDQEGTYEVDIEKLKLELGKGSNIINEGYSLNWLGQSYSRVLRDCPTTTLIKPDNNHNQLKENINSNNVYIEGDNLEVLKHLKNAYSSKIKMIYIDPPYNTGSDGFVYNDSFNFDVETFMRLSGLEKDEAERVLNYTKSKRNSHSAWLTFMYPRLYIARELLKDDGVIFISIDDNEQAQLKLLCDQIFGEENFIGCLIRKTVSNRSMAKNINKKHEYLYVYSKDIREFNLVGEEKKMTNYDNPDDDINGPWTSSDPTIRGNKNFFEIQNPITGQIDTPPKGRMWAFDREKFNQYVNEGRIVFRNEKTSGRSFTYKRYITDLKSTNKIIDSLQFCENEYLNQYSNEEIIKYFGERVFEYSKPSQFILDILRLDKNSDSIILDFFSGSSTTADAVMQLNAEDNGNRKFIMVQLPEEIDEKNSKEAYEFCTKELKQEPIIPTIAKERIKRAAKKIKEENNDKEYIDNLDLGFKVYKTIEDDRTDVSQLVLFDVKDGIKTDVDDLDALLTTWMLHDGYDLNTKVEEIMINKYNGYRVEQTLYLLDKGFSTEDLLLLVEKLNDPNTPLINQIILNSSNFGNKVLQEFHENVFSKNSKEAKIVVEDR